MKHLLLLSSSLTCHRHNIRKYHQLCRLFARTTTIRSQFWTTSSWFRRSRRMRALGWTKIQISNSQSSSSSSSSRGISYRSQSHASSNLRKTSWRFSWSKDSFATSWYSTRTTQLSVDKKKRRPSTCIFRKGSCPSSELFTSSVRLMRRGICTNLPTTGSRWKRRGVAHTANRLSRRSQMRE